jgi:hypothetical protein
VAIWPAGEFGSGRLDQTVGGYFGGKKNRREMTDALFRVRRIW